MKPKIFIDGEHGTTGLQIRSRLAERDDLEVISIPEAERRNKDLRADYLRAADIAILCLPDDASKEAVTLLEGHNSTRIIDTSTAHRVHADWAYGFAELAKGQRERISEARLVANPGCYPTGAIALVRPLRDAGLLAADYPISVNAVSGYTGGGKTRTIQSISQPITSFTACRCTTSMCRNFSCMAVWIVVRFSAQAWAVSRRV
jgi:N-acetyl-gamma-glutamyl-phosphate reductase